MQRRIVEYNHRVANMLISYNVQAMSKAIKQLQGAEHEIDPAILAGLASYRTSHFKG